MATPAAVLSILVQAKGIAQTQAQLKRLNATADDTAKHTERIASKFSGLNGTVGDFNRSMTGMRNVVGLVKFPAMIAGAGAAAQAMGALAAGAVAAGAALAPLSGAGAAVAVGYTAMGQAAGVAKLATMGLADAISGQKGAMDKLSPVQREFVKQIRGLKDETQGLRGQAQRGLLPGLSDGLKSVMPLIDRLAPLVRDTADAMGDLARRAGDLAASWGSDLTTVGRANVKIIGNIGDAALSAANAARNLIAAASPLAVWLSQLTARGAKWVSIQISAARQAGTLTEFFGKTASVIGQLIQIAQNLGTAFFNIGKAAAPLGRELLQDFTLLTAKFREWTASVSGQNKLAAYFEAAKAPLYTVFGLIGDLGAALLRLSAPSDQTTQLGQKLREIVPILENLVATTTASLGPALLNALVPVVQLLGDLAGTSGPLNILVQSIGFAAGALHKLFEVSPGLQQMTVFSLGAYGALRAVMLIMSPLTAVTRVLTVALIGQAAATSSAGLANIALRVELLAVAVAMRVQMAATAALTGAQAALNVVMTANPIGVVIVGMAAFAAAIVIAYNKSKTFRDVVSGAFNLVKQAFANMLSSLLGGVSSMLTAIGKAARAVGADGLAKKAFEGARAIDDLRDSLNAVPGSKNVDVNVKIKLDGQDVDVSKAKPLSPTPPGGDGPGVIGSRIGDLVRSSSIVRDGAKKLVADGLGSLIPGIGSGKGVGSLMGANASLKPFAAVGAQFGLHVSSGKRAAGAKTSSGGISYHGSGQAIDLANGAGPDAAKMAAFTALRSKYGARLAELIYTPAGGKQIKDGHNFLYTGSVARDHFDHVHVAFTGGAGTALGQAGNRGDGIGNVNRTFPKHGSGNAAGHVQLPPNVVRQIAVGAGLPGPAFEQIAHGESTFFPGIVSNDGGWGLWQMTPRVWGAEAKAKLGQLGGIGQMLNPLKNAMMAKWLFDRGGLSPWYGTKYLTPEARATAGAAKGKAGPGFGALAGGGTADPTGASGGGNAATGAATATAAARVNPLDQSLATADLAIEQAKHGGTVKAPGIAGRKIPSAMRQWGALSSKRALISKRIASIRKALKGHPSAAKRLALTQELTQRLQEHAQLGTDIAALRNPAAADTGGASTGIGGDLGGGGGDPNQALIDALQADADQRQKLADEQAERDEAQRQAMEAHTAAIKDSQAEIKRQTDFAVAVANTSNFQLTRSLADMLSGQIVGYGLAGRGFTPGTGVEAAY